MKIQNRFPLIKTNYCFHVAIADEPIDARVDGKKFFCVRVDNSGERSRMMIGFTPMETFDSKSEAYFGNLEGFTGCGISLDEGDLFYPVDKGHIIMDDEISFNAKEIIVILTISNNGAKKEIQFLCDGTESESTDVSEILKGDFFFPVIVFYFRDQQVTTIPIDNRSNQNSNSRNRKSHQRISKTTRSETSKKRPPQAKRRNDVRFLHAI
jgi:hypothetical protein